VTQSWERWRLAGEFLFSAPDWPALWNNRLQFHGAGETPALQEVHEQEVGAVSGAPFNHFAGVKCLISGRNGF